jgi:iron complex outermembrane receptor protein/vitamin B12 transporter
MHAAHAVVVRGRVTDALGAPLSGARVQLIENGKSVAFAYAGTDGSYEIRYSNAGRFTLLGSGSPFLPYVSPDFYGGATDVLQQDVVLAMNTVRQDISVSATGIPTPLPQLTSPVTVIPGDLFADQLGVNDLVRQSPGAFVVQTGEAGGVTSLFLRGGNSTANLVTIDGIPAEDVGGTFDYGNVSSTAISRMEIYRGPNSALFGTDAGAGVVTIETPRGTTLKPVLNYSGDAGTLHEWRDELTGGGTWQRLDYFAGFSRFDMSNAVPNDRYHNATAVGNLGYDFDGNTTLRFTIRRTVSRAGLPGGYDFQGLAEAGHQADQDLYSGITLENRFHDKWHNLVRYGIARKREQADEGNPVGVAGGFGYVGNVVTIRGANGYTATGQAQLFFGNNDDQASNRDQLYYQSDYSWSPHLIGLFGFRYDNERGAFNDYLPAYAYVENEKVRRTNFEYNLGFQGEFWNRLFYSVGGAVEKNHLYGIAGTPRFGLSYVPVRPKAGWFHGTRLRANAATGVQEPTLALEYSSLYQQLLSIGDTADIEAYHIRPQSAERSRTYDVGVDQNILGEKLVLKGGYFHNVFDRQLEGVSATALSQYFNYTFAPSTLYSAYVNSLAYRAQGAELELVWQPLPRLLVRGGYTYLDAQVLQSFASDAVEANSGAPTINPAFPNIAIGAESPLVGARPFRRAPHTGYFDVQYTYKHLGLQMLGAMASRSDDSTFLDGEDYFGTNTLLLPNRNLDFGYVKLDLGATYSWKYGLTIFGQVNNLLNDQHIGPIGFPGLPLTARAGLKLRLGGDK